MLNHFGIIFVYGMMLIWTFLLRSLNQQFLNTFSLSNVNYSFPICYCFQIVLWRALESLRLASSRELWLYVSLGISFIDFVLQWTIIVKHLLHAGQTMLVLLEMQWILRWTWSLPQGVTLSSEFYVSDFHICIDFFKLKLAETQWDLETHWFCDVK